MSTPHRLGRLGERLAARHLERAGLRVIARNWRPDGRLGVRGEIDLVCREGGTLVVCEVKTRRGRGAGHPLEAIHPRKTAQLRRLAGAYLAGCAVAVDAVRVDAVAVWWPEANAPATVEHARGVG